MQTYHSHSTEQLVHCKICVRKGQAKVAHREPKFVLLHPFPSTGLSGTWAHEWIELLFQHGLESRGSMLWQQDTGTVTSNYLLLTTF